MRLNAGFPLLIFLNKITGANIFLYTVYGFYLLFIVLKLPDRFFCTSCHLKYAKSE